MTPVAAPLRADSGARAALGALEASIARVIRGKPGAIRQAVTGPREAVKA